MMTMIKTEPISVTLILGQNQMWTCLAPNHCYAFMIFTISGFKVASAPKSAVPDYSGRAELEHPRETPNRALRTFPLRTFQSMQAGFRVPNNFRFLEKGGPKEHFSVLSVWISYPFGVWVAMTALHNSV